MSRILRQKTPGKLIINSVTAAFRAGSMTAVMGPSGAGKTTLIRLLLGEIPATSGQIRLNAQSSTPLSKVRSVVGYVPQEDLMSPELTVREILTHSARSRLPKSWEGEMVTDLVNQVIKVLDLTAVADSIVGSPGKQRGISGGQKKRVNIGMELVAVPLVLILDEPTSGLDSASALKVMQSLRDISSLGVTVISVIHQPRAEIFFGFDDVLLLLPGGFTAYMGHVDQCVSYFTGMGFGFPEMANPADVILDILAGKGITENAYQPTFLASSWNSSKRQPAAIELPDGSVMNERIIKVCQEVRGASFLKQTLLSHYRSLIQQIRSPRTLFLEIILCTVAGFALGLIVLPDRGNLFQYTFVDPYLPLSSTIVGNLIPLAALLAGISVAMAGASAGVRLFGEERRLAAREGRTGFNQFAYFLGRATSSIYRIFIAAFHYAVVFHFMMQPRTSLETMFILVLGQFIAVYGISALVSSFIRRQSAPLFAAVACLFLASFCGYGPNLKVARKGGFIFVFDLSFNRWFAEALYSMELSPFSAVYNVADAAASNFGYSLGTEAFSQGMLFLTAFGYWVLAGTFLAALPNSQKL